MEHQETWKWIAQNPEIIGGQFRIRGTRMSVAMVLELLASGVEPQEIEEQFPPFSKESIPEVLRFASMIVAGDKTNVAA